MKKWIWCAGLCILMGALTACGGTKTDQPESAAETSQPETMVTEEMLEQIQVDVGEYKGLEVEVPKYDEITDEFVDEQIQSMTASMNVDDVNSEVALKEGDQVSINYQLYDGDQPVDDPVMDYYLVIGTGVFFPGAEEALIGAKGGDVVKKEITLSEAYPNPDVAGKNVTLSMTVNGVISQNSAELDEEFIKSMSDGTCSTPEEYHAYVKAQLEEATASQKDVAIENAVWQKVIDQMKMDDLPQALIDRQVQEYTQYDEQSAKAQGMSLEQYVQEWYGISIDQYNQELKPLAENDLKLKLAVRAIIKAENMTEDQISDEDVKAFAETQGFDDPEAMKEILGEDVIKEQILKQKITKLLVDNAKVTEADVSFMDMGMMD